MEIINKFDSMVTDNGTDLRACIRQTQRVHYVTSVETDETTIHNLSKEDLLKLRDEIDFIIRIMDKESESK